MMTSPSGPGSLLPRRPSNARLEGIRAGVLGATVVWLWCFASGAISGSPLRIASHFGRGFLSIATGGAQTAIPTWEAVAAFTIVHYVVWAALASLALVFVRTAARTPSVLVFGAVIFILFQLLFVGITAILAQTALGTFAWPSVLLGNAFGCAATWWYIARRHRELRSEWAHVDDEN